MKKLKLSLRTKVVISLIFFIIVFMGMVIFVLLKIVLVSFADLENKEAIKSIERTKVVFDSQVQNMDTKLSDWAIWDDSYQFIQDKNQDYIDSNLTNESLHNLGINAMFFISSNGTILYEKQINIDTKKDASVSKNLRDTLLKSKKISSFAGIKDKNSGIIKDSSGLVLFASRPILKSDATGPIKGSLIFIRYFDKEIKEHFEAINNNYKVDILDYESTNLGEEERAREQLSADNKYYAYSHSPDMIDSFTLIYDYNNKPVYILENSIPRSIYKEGLNSILNFLYIIVILCISGVIFVLVLISKFVLLKLTRLNESVDKVKDPDQPDQRLEIKGSDEFTNLATNINQMLDQRSKSQEDLVKFKLAIENSSDQVVITDKDGKIIYVNKATGKLTGYSSEEVIGNNPRLWGRQMPKEFYVKMWDTIKNKKLPFEGRLINKNKNGKTYPVEVKIYPIIDKSGEITFFIAVERDVSSEKKIEESLIKLEKNNTFLEQSQKALANVLEDAKELGEQLKAEKENVEKKVTERTRELTEEKIKLSASISSLTLGFIMTDRNNNIVTINQAARNMLCASANSLLATVKDCTLVHIEDELKGAIDLRALIDRSVSKKQALLVKQLEFQGRFLKILITPIMELANVIGCVVLVEDITSAKILERSRDEFFSIASHELRTPLTAIRGNTSMIEEFYGDKIKDPELKDMISDIHESSVRLIEIVNDFLDTSRLEQGKMEFKRAPIDLVSLITSVIKEYQVTGSQKKLAIEYHPDEKTSIPKVFADPDKAKQVLINLIGNSLKFTEQGGVTVTTQVLKGFVKILVTDTGRGISQANQKLIFHKFQQANSSLLTRDASKGTGLGLYISKLIIEGMGGEIGLESSAEGKGTTFSFNLPIVTKEQLASPKISDNQTKVDTATGLTKQ